MQHVAFQTGGSGSVEPSARPRAIIGSSTTNEEGSACFVPPGPPSPVPLVQVALSRFLAPHEVTFALAAAEIVFGIEGHVFFHGSYKPNRSFSSSSLLYSPGLAAAGETTTFISIRTCRLASVSADFVSAWL